MLLSELLGTIVRDSIGKRIGVVVDVRFVLDGPPSGQGAGTLAEARLHGVLVSPRASTSFAGYERTGVNRPWLIAHFLAWRERGTVLVLWTDVEAVGGGELRLRRGATFYSPALESR